LVKAFFITKWFHTAQPFLTSWQLLRHWTKHSLLWHTDISTSCTHQPLPQTHRSSHFHTVQLTYTKTSSSRLKVGAVSGKFPSRCPTKILYASFAIP
jgi:hypothetical protein